MSKTEMSAQPTANRTRVLGIKHAYAAGFKEGVSRSAGGGEAVAALRELVAVKDLKDRTEALHFVGPNGDPPNENWEAEYKAGRAEYLRRQPLAWGAARAALAAPVAAPEVPEVQFPNGIQGPAGVPPSKASDWRIDTSAGRSILVYKDCSVIEAEQADYLMGLLKRAALRSGEQAPIGKAAKSYCHICGDGSNCVDNYSGPSIEGPCPNR